MFEPEAIVLSRRRFLLSALLGVVAAGGLGACALPLDPSARAARRVRALSSLNVDRDAARRFGDAYLQAHPAERDVPLLLGQIDAAMKQQHADGLDVTDPQLLRARLTRSVRDEYRRGEVVMVAGWLLSRSEARVYALITLL